MSCLLSKITRMLIGAAASLSLAITLVAPAACDEVEIKQADGKAIITLDGQPFSEYVFAGHAKPILYPIIGPTGVEMTRHYPMREGVDNEASDHPHHKSLWFTHDDVNGVHFWLEYPREGSDVNAGKIVQTDMRIEGNAIHSQDEWRASDGSVVCTDRREIAFGTTPAGRYIDFAVTIQATHGDVTFGDTKEGTMGIRTHPLLRLQSDADRGNHTAKGQSVNSEGVEGKAMWGKRAKWVDYWAPVGDAILGIAIFDHPENPRHPTWWHARHYGLVAANPFGIHDFEKKPAGTGDMTIASGDQRTFRYRFLFHRGDAKRANIAGEYDAFARGQ